METQMKTPHRTTKKHGVALIAVLGLLSIMVLLGITFAISMRTSRVATENYSHVVNARQLMHSAIARSLTNLNDKLGSDVYPNFNFEFSNAGTGIRADDILTTSNRKYIQAALQASALNETNNVQWIEILDTSDTNVVGRFAYFAINQSGLLDINKANWTPRIYGTNVNEIRIRRMSEVTDTNAFLPQRNSQWVQFETLAELQELNIGGLASDLDTLTVYSRFPDGYLEGGILESSIVIRTIADLTGLNEPEIRSRFLGITGVDADRLFNSLHDYIDADSIPQDPLGFATETHPLINELSISNNVLPVVGSIPPAFTSDWDVQVELFYPFDQPLSLGPSDLELVASITTSLPMFSGNGTIDVGGNWNTNNPYNSFAVTISGSGASPTLPTDATFDISLRVKSSGTILDQIEVFTVNSISTALPIQAEVNDPRINWNWGDHWVNSGPTPNAENTAADYDSTTDLDGSWIVHVANSNLYSVGELGHLLYSEAKPWQTIRFLNPDPDNTSKVLDWFRVSTNNSGRGKINLNSSEPEVIEAAFVDYQPRRWRGDPSYRSSNTVDTLAIANAIISPPATIMENLSDITAKLTDAEVDAALGSGIDPAFAEGLIRDSLGLIGVRQNLFTIFFIVQSGFNQVPSDPDSFIDLAEQKAVALIWRDPYPDIPGRHPVIIRNFQWLND